MKSQSGKNRQVRKASQILASFGIMYLVATLLGFATYLLVSPRAMWIGVFTLMPIVSAWLVYRYLRQRQCNAKGSLLESITLLLIWTSLSFGFDALTYILIVPAASHTLPNWTFFRDQSPWIWFSYAVLWLSGYVARWTYVQNLKPDLKQMGV